MNTGLKILLIFLFLNLSTSAQIILNEIMFNPDGENAEFIELYNNTSETIDLQSIDIIYNNSSSDQVISPEENFLLEPANFAVIFEGDYDFENGVYQNIPSDCLILQIDDNSFGRSGLANSSDRNLKIVIDFDTLSSYTYSADNSKGFSDERFSIIDSIWQNSILHHGTPGKKNSISPKEFDLKIANYLLEPSIWIENFQKHIIVKVKNEGTKLAKNFSLNLFNDSNQDSLGSPSELLKKEQIELLESSDSIDIDLDLTSLPFGYYNLILQIAFSEDGFPKNNFAFFNVKVNEKTNNYNDLVINEIMFRPNSGESEWIELQNISVSSINLKSWIFSDEKSSVQIDSAVIIEPDSFLVISDTKINLANYPNNFDYTILSLPSLNNSGDEVIIKDSLNFLIDSVKYDGSLSTENGISLERIDNETSSTETTNWSPSVSRFSSTPGMINSVSKKEYDLLLKEFSFEKNFQILPNILKGEIIIKNIGKITAEFFELKIYSDTIHTSDKMILSETFINLSARDSLIYNFKIENYQSGANYFSANIEYPEDDNIFNNSDTAFVNGIEVSENRNDLVINEIMFNPKKESCEWIEIFNRSEKNIDLKNYQLADLSDTSSFNSRSYNLEPAEYAVIIKDNSFFDLFEADSKVFQSKFPTLNNSNDQILLLDSLSRVIDSIYYYSVWNKLKGSSLERINADQISHQNNWKPFKYGIGGSPGRINTVSTKQYDVSVDTIYTDPANPYFNDDISISAKLKNCGSNQLSGIVKLFMDEGSDSLDIQEVESFKFQQLIPSDSSIINFEYKITNITKPTTIIAKCFAGSDQDTMNNSCYKNVIPGYKPKSILVNEIMNYPDKNECEWIELYNNSDQKINLKDWTISDLVSTPFVKTISNNDLFINPKEYLVISKDSSVYTNHKIIPSNVITKKFANLNNDFDAVILRDNRGAAIDSILYDDSIEIEKGISIEIKGAELILSTDKEGSTPGRINSVSPKQFDILIKNISSIPKFPERNDQIKIEATLFNFGNQNADNFDVEFIVKNDQEIVKTNLINYLSLNSKDSVKIESNEFTINDSLIAGVKILFEKDENIYNNYLEVLIYSGSGKGKIKINEIFFNSESDLQWIEFYNDSNQDINLQNWSIADSRSKKSVITNDFSASPNSFFILCNNEDFAENDDQIICVDMPELGKYEDQIKLFDFREALIDSLFYNRGFNAIKNKSSERINLNKDVNDNKNWHFSISVENATPLEHNSVCELTEIQKGSLIINEIMFEPAATNSEFMEFYNNSENEIELGSLVLSKDDEAISNFSDNSKKLLPSEYFIIADDSLFLSHYKINESENVYFSDLSNLALNNSDDVIIVKDIYGNIIDSLNYSTNWHNKHIEDCRNHSLERLSSKLKTNDGSNWSTSVDARNATPLKKNSINTKISYSNNELSLEPNPFSPDEDGREDFCVFKYTLEENLSQIRVKIFDDKGRLVKDFVNNAAAGSNGEIVYDGTDNDGNKLRTGMYIVLFEAVGNSNNSVKKLKKVLVVARNF